MQILRKSEGIRKNAREYEKNPRSDRIREIPIKFCENRTESEQILGRSERIRRTLKESVRTRQNPREYEKI